MGNKIDRRVFLRLLGLGIGAAILKGSTRNAEALKDNVAAGPGFFVTGDPDAAERMGLECNVEKTTPTTDSIPGYFGCGSQNPNGSRSCNRFEAKSNVPGKTGIYEGIYQQLLCFARKR